MPATVYVQLQLRIVGDDGTELTDYEILRLKRSGKRLEALGLSLSKARPARQHRRSGPFPHLAAAPALRRLGVRATSCEPTHRQDAVPGMAGRLPMHAGTAARCCMWCHPWG